MQTTLKTTLFTLLLIASILSYSRDVTVVIKSNGSGYFEAHIDGSSQTWYCDNTSPDICEHEITYQHER